MSTAQESLKKAMKNAPKKQGKKGRKFGRNKKSPSMASYNAGGRDKVNKAKHVAKHNAAVKEKKANPPKTPRGTARAMRRQGIAPRAERKGYIHHAQPTDAA